MCSTTRMVIAAARTSLSFCVSFIICYDMQVDDLAKVRPVLAVRLYRERYHCSLREAHDYIHRNDELPY